MRDDTSQATVKTQLIRYATKLNTMKELITGKIIDQLSNQEAVENEEEINMICHC